jgi:hypothetical protein
MFSIKYLHKMSRVILVFASKMMMISPGFVFGKGNLMAAEGRRSMDEMGDF